MGRPYLLLDVDGVLNPLGIERPVGFVRYELSGFEVDLSAGHGVMLNAMSEWFDLVWATTWEHEASLLIAPLLSLPRDLPVIEFTHGRADETWKLHDVREFVGDRPLAWVDDELGAEAYQWAEERNAQTLLVQPDPTVGLVEGHFNRLEAFGFFTFLSLLQIIPAMIYGVWVSLANRLGFPILASTVVISGLLTFFMGLLCDQITALRKERFED